jgi:anthranilate phosphoribosyltransferase
VCLNAAPAFVAAGKVKSLQEGVQLAGKVIDSGKAMDKLDKLIAFTNKV